MPSLMKLFVELSGEYPGLAQAEIMALAGAEDPKTEMIDSDDGALVIETECPPEKIAGRAALAWHVNEHYFSGRIDDVPDKIKDLKIAGSFAVRAKRMGERWSGEEVRRLTEKAGGILSERAKVDLEKPDTTIRILMSGRCHIGRRLCDVDRVQFEERRPKNRPVSHPVTLHPKLARALVNISGIRAGQTMLDPFCGTGGLLIEGMLVGAKVIGSDIDPEMLDSCRKNFEHLGLRDGCELHELDVGQIGKFGEVDAIITDPPYGKSATTMKEGIGALYRRSFKTFAKFLRPEGKLVIVFPDMKFAELADDFFALKEKHDVFVHRSLTRHFCVFEHRPK